MSYGRLVARPKPAFCNSTNSEVGVGTGHFRCAFWEKLGARVR
jgi:hypothetical protein